LLVSSTLFGMLGIKPDLIITMPIGNLTIPLLILPSLKFLVVRFVILRLLKLEKFFGFLLTPTGSSVTLMEFHLVILAIQPVEVFLEITTLM